MKNGRIFRREQKTVIMTYLCAATTPHLLPAPEVTSSGSLPASYQIASRIEQSMTGLIIKIMKNGRIFRREQKTVIMTYLFAATTPHLLPAPEVASSGSLPASYQIASRIEQSMTGLIIKNTKNGRIFRTEQKQSLRLTSVRRRPRTCYLRRKSLLLGRYQLPTK